MDPTIAPVPVGKIKIVRLYTDVQLEWVDFLSFGKRRSDAYVVKIDKNGSFKLSNLNVYDWVLNFPLQYVNGWRFSRYNI